MIEKTISEIETKIRGAETVGGERKQELLELLGKLKSEINALAQTHGAQAQTITDSIQAATHENQNPAARQNAVAGLRSSVAGIEQSHPQLVQIVNNLSNTLANLGI